MTFFTQAPTGTSYIEELDTPFGEYVSASFKNAWLRNPLPSIGRAAELSGASKGVVNDISSGEFGLPVQIDESHLSNLLPAEEARRRLRDRQLDTHLKVPDEGIRESALDILIERKQYELALKSALDRSPGGWARGGVGLAAGLAASILDPINVASAFIPVVSPTRYAAALAGAAGGAARAGVRARFGAVEGVAGAAMLEPIIAGAAAQEQADYAMADSLLNLVFGGVLGGGFHAAAGRLADWREGRQMAAQMPETVPDALAKASPEVREATARKAIAAYGPQRGRHGFNGF